MRFVLFTLNAFALLMLLGMSDLKPATRLELAAVFAVHLGCLASRHALTSRPARVGAAASITGYLGAVALWIVLVVGCGIEYFNARCDAVIDPLIAVALALGFASLPLGRAIGLVARSR